MKKIDLNDINDLVQDAVNRFWITRTSQSDRQGKKTGKKDTGSRKAVTGGKHLDGVVDMFQTLINRHCKRMTVHVQGFGQDPITQLPGYFRPTKFWDILIMDGRNLAAAIELKSQVGSFGNNYNNRCEESIGTGYDTRVAYREKLFADSPPPWIGFWMLLQDCEGATKDMKPSVSPHFPIDSEYEKASYAKRYEITLQRLIHERLYQGACLTLSAANGETATWREPAALLNNRSFASGLLGHLIGIEASK